ncbi:hypothetical protein EJ03DRAFT_329406 [Teratosphaeria nubilosa]|uniref:Uncharacterized protein n=1 Tax=Teratosphaeria nubilosa TaxID=161662 RepID=A0A6G1L343_9PEZI|nr:hypothetical protein EJ03DRAFT_329406 [Teratosphaeria nubilosa]
MQDYTRDCDPRDNTVLCYPTEDSKPGYEDCSCMRYPKKIGSKPPHDQEGIACSLPVSAQWDISIKAIDVYATVVTSKGDRSQIQGCWTESISGRHLATHYPCGSAADNGAVVALANGDSYHGCIEANDDTPSRINFEWVLQSPFGHPNGKRDENGVRHDLRDILRINRTALDPKKHRGSVVLVDPNGEVLDRFDPEHDSL